MSATDPARPRVVFSLSEEETRDLGRRVARTLEGGEVLLLVGPLGAGKTVFVRGLVHGLGGNPDEVASPTFVLCREYQARLPVFHVDLYRLEQGDDLSDLAIDELIDLRGVVVVEWGEKLPDALRQAAIEIRLSDLGEDSRRIEVIDRRLPAR